MEDLQVEIPYASVAGGILRPAMGTIASIPIRLVLNSIR